MSNVVEGTTTAEKAVDWLNTGIEILSDEVFLPEASEMISNAALQLIDQIADENSISNVELTTDLSSSMFKTLSKVGISRQLEVSEIASTAAAATEARAVKKEKSDKYMSSFKKLTDKVAEQLPVGTQSDPTVTDLFTFVAGKVKATSMSNKQIKNDESSILVPELDLDKLKTAMKWSDSSEEPIMKYKTYTFKSNPRTEQIGARGSLQEFSIYSENGREELKLQDLTNPLQLQFTVKSLSELDYNDLLCAYYENNSGLYSASGMTTVGKTKQIIGTLIHSTVTCHCTHLSEYTLSVTVDTPDVPYVPKLPKDTVTQTTAAIFSYFSIGIYIYIYIYSILGSDVYHSGNGDNRIMSNISGV